MKNESALEPTDSEHDLKMLLQNMKCQKDTYAWELAIRAYRLRDTSPVNERYKEAAIKYKALYEEVKQLNKDAFMAGYNIRDKEITGATK